MLFLINLGYPLVRFTCVFIVPPCDSPAFPHLRFYLPFYSPPSLLLSSTSCQSKTEEILYRLKTSSASSSLPKVCWKSTSCLERERGGRVASLLLAIAFGTVVGAQLQQVVSELRLGVQILRLTSALGQVQVGRN